MRKIKRRKPEVVPKTKKIKTHKQGRRRRIEVPRRSLKRRKGSELNIRGTSPSKLTLHKRKLVYAAVEAGMPLSRCRHLIGCAASTWHNYTTYGKDPSLPKYFNFFKKIKRLQKKREVEALEVIRAAAKGGFEITKTEVKAGVKGTTITTVTSNLAPQWQAAAWFLERKDKANWGREPLGETKNPMELAQEIQDAQMVLSNSVPTAPPKEEE